LLIIIFNIYILKKKNIGIFDNSMLKTLSSVSILYLYIKIVPIVILHNYNCKLEIHNVQIKYGKNNNMF